MPDRIYSIYKITNTINGKVYIGFTSKDPPKRRFGEHCKPSNTRYCHLLGRAIQKHGKDNFTFEILVQSKDFEYISKELEPEFIAKFQSNNPQFGYNLTDGGEGMTGYTHSEETKEKIRLARSTQVFSEESLAKLKGKIPWNKGKTGVYSEETKNKMREAKAGKPGNNKGHKFSDLAKNNMSKARKGKKLVPHSEETKRKISESQKGEKGYWYGKKQSPEMIAKRVAKLTGAGNGNYGRKFTDEHRQKLRDAKAKKRADKAALIENKLIENF